MFLIFNILKYINMMTIRRILNFILIFACLSPFLWAADSTMIKLTLEEKRWIAAHPILRVANEDDWPPLDFSVNGKAKGLSIDYIRLVTKKTGLEIQFINGFTWKELQEQAKNKELEVLTSIVKTEQREKLYLFTEPYLKIPTVIVALKNNTSITNIKDLSGKKVATIKGYYPDIQRIHVENVLEGLKAVSYDGCG